MADATATFEAKALGGELYSPTSPAPGEAPDGLDGSSRDVPSATVRPVKSLEVKSLTGLEASADRMAAMGSTGAGLSSRLDVPTLESPDHSPVPSEREGRTPVIFMGSKLDKRVSLKSNRWLNIGRGELCDLRLENHGVSRNHCSFMWDTHRRVVELRDTSSTGTIVNGEVLIKSTRLLGHADLVSVPGKQKHFDFVVDLRPVRLGFGRPVEEALKRAKGNEGQKRDGEKAVQRMDTLKEQLQLLEESLQRCEERAFDMELQYYEIMRKDKMRIAEEQHKLEQLQRYERGADVLQQKLQESREHWLTKLDRMYESNQDAETPLVEDAQTMLTKLEKLAMKKDELAREAHPDQFALQGADEGLLELPGGAPDAAGQDGLSDEDEADLGQQPAPADVPGAAAAAAEAAAAEDQEEDQNADLFGDFDSADEAEAARDAALAAAAAAEGETEPAAKRQKVADG